MTNRELEEFVIKKFLEFHNNAHSAKFSIKARPDKEHTNEQLCDFLAMDNANYLLIGIKRIPKLQVTEGKPLVDGTKKLRSDLQNKFSDYEICIYCYILKEDINIKSDVIEKNIGQIIREEKFGSPIKINNELSISIDKTKTGKGKCRILPWSLKIDMKSLKKIFHTALCQLRNTEQRYLCGGKSKKILLFIRMSAGPISIYDDIKTVMLLNKLDGKEYLIYDIKLYPNENNETSITEVYPDESSCAFFQYESNDFFGNEISPLFPDPLIKGLLKSSN